jgi:predicted transcriptional regulator
LENGSLDAKTKLVGEYQAFRLFSTEIKGDLLILFHKNPGLIDTFDGVARRIGRTAKAIEEDVRDLVTIGILRTRKIGAYEVITFDRSKDNETQESIVNHLKGIRAGRAI